MENPTTQIKGMTKQGKTFMRLLLSFLLVLLMMPNMALLAFADEGDSEDTFALSEPLEEVDDEALAEEEEAVLSEDPVQEEEDLVQAAEENKAQEKAGHAKKAKKAKSSKASGKESKKEQLRITGLTSEQRAALGGKDRLVKELELFLQQEQIGKATKAAVVEYLEKRSAIVVLFELDDAFCTQVKLVYKKGSYAFSRYIPVVEDEQEAAFEESIESDQAQEEEENSFAEEIEPFVAIAPMAEEISPMAAPPHDLQGRFVLDPGFYCTPSFMGGFPGTITISGHKVVSFGTDNAGTNGHVFCVSPGAANWGDPSNGNNRAGTVYATYLRDEQANGVAVYSITIEPDNQPAPPGSVNGIQYLGSAILKIAHDFDGVIELYKKSSNTSITNNNTRYSLRGAQYGVYTSSTDARNDRNRVTVLTTNSTGYAKSGKLTQATYYVREIVASTGYLLDTTVYRVNLNDTAVVLNVLETPQAGNVSVLVQKLDATTGKAYGKDDPKGLSLADAQFTISFYPGYYNSVSAAQASGNPTRTWVIKTLEGGKASLTADCLVAGSSALYKNAAGNTVLPLGTILIQETKQPVGYLLPNPNPIVLQQVRVDPASNSVPRLNAVEFPDEPHELKLIKTDIQTDELLGGAEFTLERESALGKGDWKKLADFVTNDEGSFEMSPIAEGSYHLVETKAPEGYQLPSQAGQPVEIPFTITKNTTVKVIEAKDYQNRIITPQKLDMDTKEPIPDTEFTLYQYPVELKDGKVITDTSGISADAAGWTLVGSAITGADGKTQFSDLPYGYYQLVESRPNLAYASYAESGGKDRLFILDKHATSEVQVFEDMLIKISCEVYKKTIALTSSGLNASSAGAANNVGHEEYLYHFGARSTSNVWADEFIVVDDLSYVTSLGYRMTILWTGTSPVGMDYDDKMAVLYKTNLTTADEQVVFSYNPLSANPYNPNNPNREAVYSNEPGWRIWAEELPTTQQVKLEVADLNLKEGEYIIGLKIVYGGVSEGFYTGNGWQLEQDPHTVKSSGKKSSSSDSNLLLLSSSEGLLEDWWYSVVATEDLLPLNKLGDETVMRGSITSDIARNNGVLTDNDSDAVETRVIGYFSFPTTSNGLIGMPQIADFPTPLFPSPRPTGIPRTGDNLLLYGLAAGILVAGSALMATSRRLRKGETTLN